MLDSFESGNGNDGCGLGTEGDRVPRCTSATSHGLSEDATAARGQGPCTRALDEIRQKSADLASLLALTVDYIPVFVLRLTHAEPGLKALEQRGGDIAAMRTACADRIQQMITEGEPIQRPTGRSMKDVIARAVEIAQAHPDPSARTANVDDAVGALYQLATDDRELASLLAGRRLLSVADQVTTETQKFAAMVQVALVSRMDQAEKAIIDELVRSRPAGVTPAKLAAGVIVLLCAATGLAIYWAGLLPQLRQAIAALVLLST